MSSFVFGKINCKIANNTKHRRTEPLIGHNCMLFKHIQQWSTPAVAWGENSVPG